MVLQDPRTVARYALAKPAGTHRRPAGCEEVSCKYFRNGWRMRVLVDTEMGKRQAYLIKESGRRYTVEQTYGEATYTFEPGQNCFGAHTVPLDRPALYLVRQGAGPVVHHVRPEHWVEDFSTHLDKIREQGNG